MLLFLLLVLPVLQAPAQKNTPPSIMESNLPQWVKDLRRWEIVTLGSIPFTMFTATFVIDMFRWSQANGMDFSDAGRRYAPWPLKSAGAIAMDNDEQAMTVAIAGGLSLAVGIADLIIVQIRRYRARKRAEALPVGTAIITHSPWGEEPEPVPEDETAIVPNDGTVPDEGSPVTP